MVVEFGHECFFSINTLTNQVHVPSIIIQELLAANDCAWNENSWLVTVRQSVVVESTEAENFARDDYEEWSLTRIITDNSIAGFKWLDLHLVQYESFILLVNTGKELFEDLVLQEEVS